MATDIDTPDIVRESVAARRLGVSKASLRRWRRERRGPNFVRLERAIGYRLSDLEQFLSKNTVTSQQASGKAK